ncbi:MAG: lipid-A-disaccharide synthase [Chitinophagales bacterium]|nr:lipid-A-disaccharide synthase [Chitinophagales bacterium]
MKLYCIAGEASGDLHGSNLIKALRHRAPEVQIRAWGGDLMSEAGAEVVKHYRELAFMGFVEVVKNLRTIFRNLELCKNDIRAFQPDVLVLIDYPGFNLRIARWAKAQGIRVVYYISPQIWAWHTSRVKQIRRDVDEMLVILPFEADFYKKHQVNVHFVGHPLLDALPEDGDVQKSEPPSIALLPGSRRQEVSRMLPTMLEASKYFPEYQFIIAASAALPMEWLETFTAAYPNVRLEQGRTYDIIRAARLAVVKSGTSTLETALLGTPEVVVYAGSPVSYAIARRLIQVKYISLVNLILDRPLVQELIQQDLNVENLRTAISDLLKKETQAHLQEGYKALRMVLGEKGASGRAADIILQQA